MDATALAQLQEVFGEEGHRTLEEIAAENGLDVEELIVTRRALGLATEAELPRRQSSRKTQAVTLRPVTGTSVSLLVLYCADPDVTAAFYERFGLVFAHEQHGAGPLHRAAELGDGLVLELYPARDGQTTAPLRIGLHLAAGTAEHPQVLVDPDGRKVVIETSPPDDR